MKTIRVELDCTKVKWFTCNKTLPIGRELFMFKSGAKLFRSRFNLFLISGYALDGKDTIEALKEIVENDLM